MKPMTISHAAQKAGVGVETIRFYERVGLIEQPLKSAGAGFREYPETTVQLVHFIRQAQETGFSLKEIKELLSLRIDPEADCSQVRERARLKLDEVNSRIENMTAMKAVLETLIIACPGEGAVGKCSIMEALAMKGLRNSGVEHNRPLS